MFVSTGGQRESGHHGVDNPDAVGQYESVRQYVYCEDHFDRMT